jgi:sulfonate transport system permease protein
MALAGTETIVAFSWESRMSTASSLPTVASAPDASAADATDFAAAGSAAAASTSSPARTRRRFRPGGRAWRRLISPLALLIIWQAVGELKLMSTQKLPEPTQVAHTAYTLIATHSAAYGTLQGAMLASLQRWGLGFVFGGLVAFVLALIAGLSRNGEDAVDPLMQMLRTLPLFGLIPVFEVWFGIDLLPKVLLIAIGTAIPIYLNTFSGIRSVDGSLGELARALKLSYREKLWHIILPGAFPSILVGLRQGLATGLLALVVAEQINANSGLGFIINQGAQFLNNNVIIVALLVYTLLGLITDWIVRVIERRTLTWRRGIEVTK